ncbi:hypothetical protein [Tumebacillus permanentifrigoris]|uniref:Uncharacterized protein n=1 Tax=Tumebacillus permanentifrigoris TaxID=378543 RepID=A0A316D2C4_9BACL|nr:hypothetical protein [Tumebacillus permanentifrigoris]PWK05017.1 hypothetical protein C7459_12915 [Tumebacillus permanentifrigoris]
MKKRWWLAGTAILVLLGGGYALKQYATAKIGDQVVQMINEPDVQKAIDNAIAQGNLQELPLDLTTEIGTSTETPSEAATATPSAQVEGQPEGSSDMPNTVQGSAGAESNAPNASLKSREDAVAYAQSKFSATEIASYLSAYQNKAQLSSAEKASIKAEILSHFSAAELRALQEAAKN